jgi:hypothetical protein
MASLPRAYSRIAAVLVLRFLRTGGPAMLRMMSAPPQTMPMDHEHGGEHGSHAGMA